MDMTRERISLIFELTVMFLSFHKGFNLVSAAVVCAILASISGLEPSQRTINEWNKLSTDCVTASSVNMFKNKVDTYLRRAGYK